MIEEEDLFIILIKVYLKKASIIYESIFRIYVRQLRNDWFGINDDGTDSVIIRHSWRKLS
jgi:hypothetical protein